MAAAGRHLPRTTTREVPNALLETDQIEPVDSDGDRVRGPRNKMEKR